MDKQKRRGNGTCMSLQIGIASLVFLATMLVIFWRPKGLNEAWPASIGAVIVLLAGIVSQADIMDIISKIGGASITIIATIVMAVILESFGFFNWAAARLANLAKGSGYRLYWYIQLLCFLMTLLFNNDGSILITTPILILLLHNLRLKPHQQIPYLLSGALIATASSAPIGVSNIVNLIALNIVEMSLMDAYGNDVCSRYIRFVVYVILDVSRCKEKATQNIARFSNRY